MHLSFFLGPGWVIGFLKYFNIPVTQVLQTFTDGRVRTAKRQRLRARTEQVQKNRYWKKHGNNSNVVEDSSYVRQVDQEVELELVYDPRNSDSVELLHVKMTDLGQKVKLNDAAANDLEKATREQGKGASKFLWHQARALGITGINALHLNILLWMFNLFCLLYSFSMLYF